MSPTTEPTPHLPTRRNKDREDAFLAAIRRVDMQIRRKAGLIVNAAMDSQLIDDNGMPVDGWMEHGRPQGWSPKRHQVAMDARRPLKQQPGYVGMAMRAWETYQRLEKDVEKSPVLHAEVVIVQNNTTVYPVVDLDKDTR